MKESDYTKHKRLFPDARTANEESADRFPTVRSRDGGDRKTLGELVRTFADVVDDRPEEASEWLDREFLFGAWGDVMREVVPKDFGRDVRGFIKAAYLEGRDRTTFKRAVNGVSDCLADEARVVVDGRDEVVGTEGGGE